MTEEMGNSKEYAKTIMKNTKYNEQFKGKTYFDTLQKN